ncbi:solute carrier family 22 member 6-like [Penaeus japonicus]|uniref:solute carrier family 22 member 6-like n=1 Tax=Penaeus japonicus TaxID=27405 RepID=UPI001C710E89|nr:solute carrier family 22 member 6-like [Penaeus japonicus]
MAKRLDDVMALLGTGPWNVLHFLSLSYFKSVKISYSYTFTASPNHVPHLGGAFSSPPSGLHLPTARGRPQHDRRSLPALGPVGGDATVEAKPECSYFALNSSSGQVEEELCTEWDFDNSTFSSTVGTEFQLACGWEYLRSTYQSIYMFGVTIGAPFNGILADRYGRKMTVAAGFLAYAALALGLAGSPTSGAPPARFTSAPSTPPFRKTGYIPGGSPCNNQSTQPRNIRQ